MSTRAKFRLSVLSGTGLLVALFTPGQKACAGDICGAKANIGASAGSSVSFHGTVSSDGMHATLISPDACKSEWYGVLWTGEDGDPAYLLRRSLTSIGFIGTRDKDVSVDVDAVIVTLPNGKVGVRLTRLNRLALIYPRASAD